MNKKRIRFLVFAAVLVVVFAIALPAAADKPSYELAGQVEESPNGVYIVQMIDMPVVAYEGDIKGYKATKPAKGEKINPNHPAVVKYAEYLDSKHDESPSKSRRWEKTI